VIRGRLLQRVHLAATANGLALQHMNQITERVDREASLGKPATFAPRLDAVCWQTPAGTAWSPSGSATRSAPHDAAPAVPSPR
jgi:hypothetical protein